jgi:hypothetical protein
MGDAFCLSACLLAQLFDDGFDGGGEFAVRSELQIFLVSYDGLSVLLQPPEGSAEQGKY